MPVTRSMSSTNLANLEERFNTSKTENKSWRESTETRLDRMEEMLAKLLENQIKPCQHAPPKEGSDLEEKSSEAAPNRGKSVMEEGSGSGAGHGMFSKVTLPYGEASPLPRPAYQGQQSYGQQAFGSTYIDPYLGEPLNFGRQPTLQQGVFGNPRSNSSLGDDSLQGINSLEDCSNINLYYKYLIVKCSLGLGEAP